MQADKKTIVRRIMDYLHKYGQEKEVLLIAEQLNISVEEKKRIE